MRHHIRLAAVVFTASAFAMSMAPAASAATDAPSGTVSCSPQYRVCHPQRAHKLHCEEVPEKYRNSWHPFGRTMTCWRADRGPRRSWEPPGY